jgi:hypothetical protein
MEEHKGIFSRWLDRTAKELILQLDKKNVKDTAALKRGLRTRMSDDGNGILRGEIIFMDRGRFVDMGAGRRAKLGSVNKRKPKVWYSRTFYGRLNTLQGAIGIQVMEEAIQATKTATDGKDG